MLPVNQRIMYSYTFPCRVENKEKRWQIQKTGADRGRKSSVCVCICGINGLWPFFFLPLPAIEEATTDTEWPNDRPTSRMGERMKKGAEKWRR